jgi:UDP-N-acetylmuramoylalanine--D-glutamate ligase
LLLWNHNKNNICGVTWILDVISNNYSVDDLILLPNLLNSLNNILKIFSWLSHRLETIWINNWITFIDDGISTTPESTIEAINTFWEQVNTIFLGGGDYGFKKESYKILIDKLIEHKVKNIVLFPDTWLDIFNIERLSKKSWDIFSIMYEWFEFNILYSNNMKSAVEFSYKHTWLKNICLMSCAAPSYSLWTWYEEKWREFKKYINLEK